jgi:ribonuclease E
MIGTDYELEKRKTSSRIIADVFDMPTAREMEAVANIDVTKSTEESETSTNLDDDDKPKKRRRRRRRKPRKDEIAPNTSNEAEDVNQGDAPSSDKSNFVELEPVKEQSIEPKAAKSKRKPKIKDITEIEINISEKPSDAKQSVVEISEEIKPKKRKRRTKAQIEADEAEAKKNKDSGKPKKSQPKAKKSTGKSSSSGIKAEEKKTKSLTKAKKSTVEASEDVKISPEGKSISLEDEVPTKPKRRGWWSKS